MMPITVSIYCLEVHACMIQLASIAYNREKQKAQEQSQVCVPQCKMVTEMIVCVCVWHVLTEGCRQLC